MSIKQELFTSFIKGVGKTLGTVVIFGVCGTVFYFYSNKTSITSNTLNEDQIVNVIEDQENETKSVNQTTDLNMDEVDVDTEEQHFVDSKYKVIFDNLLH